jgi:hypothetical protein
MKGLELGTTFMACFWNGSTPGTGSKGVTMYQAFYVDITRARSILSSYQSTECEKLLG